MERPISEADWKRLRRLEPLALDRFCRRVLAEVAGVAEDDTRSGHDRYLAVYRLVEERDRELAAAFDGTRRSTAIVQLARMGALGVVTDEELAGFSDDIRARVSVLLQVWGAEPPVAGPDHNAEPGR